LNYPTTNRGILIVYNSNNTIYQSYQTAGSVNNLYWRSTLSGTTTFSSWSLASKDGHTHDNLYYTIAQINNKIDPSPTANRAIVTDSSGRLSSVTSNVGATEIGYLSGLSSSVQAQLNDRALENHNHDDLYYRKNEVPRLFVQQNQPSNAQIGDLWVW
jgi:hypothetical protein